MLVEDEPDGFMRLGWQRDEESGLIRFYDRTMWASRQIYETLEASVDGSTAAPVDINITFFQETAILTVEAREQDGVMVGSRIFTRPGADDQSASIETPVTESMVMRGAVFFLAPTLPLEIGDSITFDWFAPLWGSAATVTLTAADGGTIQTLGGTHEPIRIEVRGGSTDNDIYVSANDGVREVVRIDVLGQPMRFEAVPAVAGE